MPFFHGTEVDDVAALLIAIAQVNGSTIALVGTAPERPAGMTLVSTPNDAIQFGKSVFDGRTIPHALDAIIAQGASQVFVINCFKPGHLVAVVNESIVVPASLKVPIAFIPVGPVVVKNNHQVPVVLTAGVDYVYVNGDKFITIIPRSSVIVSDILELSYSYFDATLVVANDIIGGTDVATGSRTGIALLDLAFAETGITPKILISPIYSEIETVMDALLAQSGKLRARVPNNAPNNLTIAQAIASRGPLGTYANWNSQNPRLIPIFPYVYKPDPLSPDTPGVAFPYCAYFAGMWAASMNRKGIQQSPSNLVLAGFKKLVRPISCTIGDRTSDASILNAAGISTVFTGFGVGPKSWGNRSAAFPALNIISTFMSVHFVQDILDESVQMASLAYQDLPLDLALIDTIVSAVNALINSMILAKALIGGECYYNPALNTPTQLASGYVIISYRDLPPPPAEGITFQSLIDISIFTSSGLSA